MFNAQQTILKTAAALFGSTIAYAHCDIPCGIYDPHQAQIAALTTIRMADLITELKGLHASDDHHHNTEHDLIRIVNVKDQHAEICKREVAVIWGDYFKPEMIEKHPHLHELVHSIMQTASKTRQSDERANGEKLLELVNEFAKIFWETKGKETKEVTAPYKPEAKIVLPILE